jgi:hypothetical protein
MVMAEFRCGRSSVTLPLPLPCCVAPIAVIVMPLFRRPLTCGAKLLAIGGN